MSVAFRRESDEEHKEPRFELPIPPGVNFVTPTGLAQIQERVKQLESLLLQEADEPRVAELKRDLRYWRTRLATAEPAPPPPKDYVAFGSVITFTLRGETRTITIVGDDEADPACHRISFSAPLARALSGAAVGDHADFAGEEEAIEVLQIDQSF